MGNVIDVNNICVNCMHTMDETTRYCPSCGYERGTYVNNPHQLPAFTILQGRYLIGKCLGEGGFGITYLALDLISGQRVAIKELFVQGLLNRQKGKTVLIESSQESMRYYHICKDKFLHEAQLLHNLKEKRGVVNFLNYFEENNTAYIVMEYLEGQDLSQYLKEHNNRISFHETFQFLRPVMKSLIDMNESGVYHRDIAPDNIRYLKSGWMKIMDLGGAKYSFQEQVNGPSRMIAVKKEYAPPEQYQQSYKIGPWICDGSHILQMCYRKSSTGISVQTGGGSSGKTRTFLPGSEQCHRKSHSERTGTADRRSVYGYEIFL